MIEESESPSFQQFEISDLTNALISALGIKTSEQGEKIQSATIFLSKLHRKYYQQQGKKYNEVKLSRLNGLLFKICKEPPTQKSDLALITQIIFDFLNNQGSVPINDSSFTSNTCYWVAKVLQEVLSLKSPESCSEMLNYLLNQKKNNPTNPEEFDKLISASGYFKDKQIVKEDEQAANKRQAFKGFMTEYSCSEQIKSNLNLIRLFSNLYSTHTSKKQVFQLFTEFCRQTQVENIQETFVKIFIQDKSQTPQTANYILECLDSQVFSSEDFTQIVKLLINSPDRKIFSSLELKDKKNQNRYIEILSENMKVNFVDQLADIFMNSLEINNYYLLYLIQKSNYKLSQNYMILPIGKTITNRIAIICAIAISHNIPNSHTKILQYFFENETAMNNKQKLDFLRIAHFSYLDVPKSHLFTSILKFVPASLLDKQSNFEFLPKQNYEKIVLEKNEREELNDFLSRYFGNNSEVSWIKLDLYVLCGKQLPCMQDFKNVQKIFEAPVDQILSELYSLPQNLLQVVLMGVNNKLSEQYIVNQNNISSVIQWALDSYKKQYKKFKVLVETALKRSNNVNLVDICLEIFDFNLDHSVDLEFSDEFAHITSTHSHRKLRGLNFSDYFMASDPEQNQFEGNLLRTKNTVTELQRLIRLFSNEVKAQNKKELKAISNEDSIPLRALKIIKSLSLVPQQKLKNPQKIKNLTNKLLAYVKPELQNLKHLSKSAASLNIQYCPIFDSLQFLLNVNYEQTIIFLAQLLKSKQIKIEQKTKKNKKKADQNNEKIESFSQNLEICFRGDPSLLANYDPIISIIEELENSPFNKNLSVELVRWVSKIKIFHKEEYQSWKEKVLNFIKLWQAISNIVAKSISVKQIQRHFLIMIDLLNTLYQKYKDQKDHPLVEKKLFNGLYVLYFLADAQRLDMQEQVESQIPREKLSDILVNHEPNQISDSHIYYCFDCSKKICHECSQIVHRNHDKNYIGQGSQSECHRQGSSKSKQADKAKMTKEKYIQKLMKQGNIEALERERLLSLQQGSQNWSSQQFARFHEQKMLMMRRNQRLATLLAQSEGLDAEQQQQKKKQQADEDQKMQIKSCSQKQFNLKSTNFVSKESKPTPRTNLQSKQIRRAKPVQLNLAPLFNLLVRELKSFSFVSNLDSDLDQKGSGAQFQAQLSNEKYTIIKVDVFKNNLPRIGSNYLTSSENHPNLFAITKRNVLTINEKLLAVLSGGYSSQIHYLDTSSIKTKFLKRESQKRYKQNDTIDNYQISQSKLSQPSILEIIMSPHSQNLIAQISATRIVFDQISRDGRSRGVCSTQTNGSEILKFEWLRPHGLRNFYAYLSNGELFIGKIGKKQIELEQKIILGNKKIKDFSNSVLSSRVAMITFLGLQGKVYRTKMDPTSKKIPNFRDFEVEYNSPDQITSVYNQGVSVYCTTNSGKIVIMNFSDSNTLSSVPGSFSIIQPFKSCKLSQINSKFKEVTRIIKLRYVAKQQNEVFLSCILTKQSPAQLKKTGYFVIISINSKTKKCKVLLFNDQGNTDCYDILTMNQKEYFFICLLDDGQLWANKFTCQSKSSSNRFNDCNIITSLSLNDIAIYSDYVSKYGLFNQIQFYNKDRKKSAFKQNLKITDHFKVNPTQNSINFQPIQKFIRSEFVTGIQFGYNHNPDVDGEKSNLVFTFLQNTYKFQIQRTRQIQISLTIRETLSLYLGLVPFKVQFQKGKPNTNIKNITVFGVRYADRSVYLDALTSLFQTVCIYLCPKQFKNDKTLEMYFYNDREMQLSASNPKILEEYFSKKKMSVEQQNLLFKLQLLRQSTPQTDIQSTFVLQCFENIRNHIIPNCYQRKQLQVSLKKLCQKLSMASRENSAMKLGHVQNYDTQLDIHNLFKLYKVFRIQGTVDSYGDLLENFNKVLNTRTLNAFIVLSIYPQMIWEMCRFFKKILSQYRLFFKVNEIGLEKEQKQKINRLCNKLLRVLIQNYQLNKNRSVKINCQQQILHMLEGMFCFSRKQVHKQIKLNPFQYFDSAFKQGKYEYKSPPINFLTIQQLDVQVQKVAVPQQPASSQEQAIRQNNPIVNQPQPNLSSNSNNNEQQIQIQDEESREQHKQQQQQNRQMIEELGYDMQAEVNMKIGDMQDEDLGSQLNERNQLNSEQSDLDLEIDSNKVYQYLTTKCSEMIPQSISFSYEGVCQNVLLQLFGPANQNKHKYIYSQNTVFYIGLVYNLMQNIENKIQRIFQVSNGQDITHPYLQNRVFPIIKAIDQKIDSLPHSILYLPLNSMFTANLKVQKTKSALIKCFISYYNQNISQSKFLEQITSQKWNIQQLKPAASLSSVLRFEYFDSINPIYQLKFVGNLYTHFLKVNNSVLHQNQGKIMQNVLKAVVKYKLRVFHNIMVFKKWDCDLQKTKIGVAFDRIGNKPEQSLKTIMKLIDQHIKIFVEYVLKNPQKISDLESLLGSNGELDEMVLSILNSYYSYEDKK